MRRKKILKLNIEFESVKILLKNYLIGKVNQIYDFTKIEDSKELTKILEVFESNNFFQNHLNFKEKIENYSEEFSFSDDRNDVLSISNTLIESTEKKVTYSSLFLDFNYTSTIPFYIKELGNRVADYSINKIHGDLNDMVFGFGDEIDEDYKLIENLDDNEYLKFFKSFKYFQNRKYNKLLEYIDSGKFQIFVLGHSCGLSDRVMLNTIFEHNNCRSIKIYYHQKEDGSDNYSDVVKNISRHFKDKPSMRRKIVSKELSSPLPQNVRFRKR